MKIQSILRFAFALVFTGTSFGQITSMNENLAVLPGSITTNVFATTTGDIVSLEKLTLTMENGLIFNLGAPFGRDISDACPDFCSFEPLAEADSYVTTPGSTFPLGTPPPYIRPDGMPINTWADTSDDGPQDNFQIARITLQPSDGRGLMQGTLQFVNQAGNLEPMPFSVVIGVPEPASAVLSLIAGLVMLGFRRRSLG